MKEYDIKRNVLSVEDYLFMWRLSWKNAPTEKQAELAIENSLVTVAAFDGGSIVGMARLIGDVGLYYYIKDIAVLPGYQKNGVGKLMIAEIKKYIRENSLKGSNISIEICYEPERAVLKSAGLNTGDTDGIIMNMKVR